MNGQQKDDCKIGNDNANIGNDYKSLGDFRKAIEYHEKYLKSAIEIGDRAREGKACRKPQECLSVTG